MSDKKKLEALRSLFKKEKEVKSGGGKSRRGDFWPFWEMKVGEEAKVRILPDKNEENPFFFYVERLEHNLTIDGKKETVPCLNMYGEKCPICELSQRFYKEGDKETGKYYYRKKTSILRLLILDDPLPPDEETQQTCEGKVVTTQFAYQLMEKIKEEISGEDLEALPWGIENGYDFKIKKSSQKTPTGEVGNYAMASGFVRRPSAIDDQYVETIEDNLIDLETLLPKNPGYELVKRKLDAHLNGSDEGDNEDEHEESSSRSTKSTNRGRDLDNDSNNDDDEDGENIIASLKNRTKSTKVKEEESPEDSDEDDEDDDGDILAKIRRNNKRK